MFRNFVAKQIFNKVNIDGFAFDAEVLLLAKIQNYKVVEIPIIWRHSKNTKVKFIKDGINMLLDVLKVKINYLRGKYK